MFRMFRICVWNFEGLESLLLYLEIAHLFEPVANHGSSLRKLALIDSEEDRLPPETMGKRFYQVLESCPHLEQLAMPFFRQEHESDAEYIASIFKVSINHSLSRSESILELICIFAGFVGEIRKPPDSAIADALTSFYDLFKLTPCLRTLFMRDESIVDMKLIGLYRRAASLAFRYLESSQVAPHLKVISIHTDNMQSDRFGETSTNAQSYPCQDLVPQKQTFPWKSEQHIVAFPCPKAAIKYIKPLPDILEFKPMAGSLRVGRATFKRISFTFVPVLHHPDMICLAVVWMERKSPAEDQRPGFPSLTMQDTFTLREDRKHFVLTTDRLADILRLRTTSEPPNVQPFTNSLACSITFQSNNRYSLQHATRGILSFHARSLLQLVLLLVTVMGTIKLLFVVHLL